MVEGGRIVFVIVDFLIYAERLKAWLQDCDSLSILFAKGCDVSFISTRQIGKESTPGTRTYVGSAARCAASLGALRREATIRWTAIFIFSVVPGE